jgi:cytochrome c oxidase subunit II
MPSTEHAYDHVAGIYFPIAAGVFAVVVITVGAMVVRGARRAAPSGPSEANRLEALYALLLAGAVAVLVWVTFTAETRIDRLVARPAVRMRIVAGQWSWTLSYADGRSVTAIATWHPPVVVVPAGEEVQFAGTSRDVIHGFWIPRVEYMRQLVPGHVSRFDLLFPKPGRYGGECSVYCGVLHSQMHFAIDAVAPARFRAWLASGGKRL